MPKLKRTMEQHPGTFQSGVHLMWDNANCHKVGDIFTGESMKFTVLPVPPRSPEFNKVVEHAINMLKAEANKYFHDHPEIPHIQYIKEHFRDLFFRVVKKTSVQRDIRSMRATYDIFARSVEHGGVAGGYPPKQYKYVASQKKHDELPLLLHRSPPVCPCARGLVTHP